jgi:hypothetical protein
LAGNIHTLRFRTAGFGLRDSLRIRLVEIDPEHIVEANVISSLATDLAAAKIEYLHQLETVRKAIRELGDE